MMECFGRQPKKERDLYCAIQLLDESEISFNIQVSIVMLNDHLQSCMLFFNNPE